MLVETNMEQASENTSAWDERFFSLAQHVSSWSRDPSTRVGCVIVGPTNEVRALGYNGLPRNIEDLEGRFQRPNKYAWVEHAERNAIYAASRIGVPLNGCKMYVSWFPCVECARAALQVGIAEIIASEPDWQSPHWGNQFILARELLAEGGIKLRTMKPAGQSRGVESVLSA